MYEIPVLKIELEGLRASVSHMFSDRNDELSQMISDTLEKTLTEEWVKNEVNLAVECCIKGAIKGIADNYSMRSSLEDLICSTIRDKISENDSA